MNKGMRIAGPAFADGPGVEDRGDFLRLERAIVEAHLVEAADEFAARERIAAEPEVFAGSEQRLVRAHVPFGVELAIAIEAQQATIAIVGDGRMDPLVQR